MKLTKPAADVFVPGGGDAEEAIARTTHLAVGAHQDDIEFMAVHGILECFRRSDRSFTGVTVTDGSGSPRSGRYGEVSDEEMRRIRLVEQRTAAQIGDYGCQLQLGFSSSEVKDPANPGPVADLEEVLRLARPEVVYLHNPADKHDTHVACCLRALAALRRLRAEGWPAAVWGCEVWRSLDWVPDEEKVVLTVDVSPNLEAALSGVFDSQIAGGKRYDLAVAGRRLANATFFESHAVDRHGRVSFAMDLTPLVADPTLDVAAHAVALLRRTERDVRDRILRLGGSG